MSATSQIAWTDIVQQLESQGPSLSIQNKVARQVQEAISANQLPGNVTILDIALLRSFTIEPLVPPLVAQLARRGLAASIRSGRLGNFAEEIVRRELFLDPGHFDATILFVLPDALAGSFFDAPPPGALNAAVEHFLHLVESLVGTSTGQVIVANFALPESVLARNYTCRIPEHGRYQISVLNRRLAQLSTRYPHLVIWDVEFLASRMGLSSFWSARDYAASMQPFSTQALNTLASALADLFSLVFRRSPVKCIVVDCDNTLWGGVVGEDGPNAIELGDTYPGSCYRQFQHQLSQLRRLGYLLALNSKNDESLVQSVFEQHSGVALKWEEFSAIRANWTDKVTNLQDIAAELNLGLDSVLFIDDNDFELDLVRSALPQVRCLKMPAQPWLVPSVLPLCEWIDCLSVTAEDKIRAANYTADRQRKRLEDAATDHSAYLRDLKMVATIEEFVADRHLSRAAQLTQRTNQFNLTARRYSEAELLGANERGAMIFVGALCDRFGDYGRVLMAILKPKPLGVVELDTYLMSCRALGRTVEDGWFAAILSMLKRLGYCEVRAEYIPTARNSVCAQFLDRNGFELLEQRLDGGKVYKCTLAAMEGKENDLFRIEVHGGR
jgi:FkbH-like protein